MSKYSHILSPVKVGNMVLKSRLVSANSLPHFLQGPETYPTEQTMHHLSSIARNGAAIVTFADWTNMNQRESFNEDGRRFPMYDLSDPSVENYICQLAENVHYYDSRLSLALMPFAAPDPLFDVCDAPAIELKIDSKNFRDGQDDYDASVMIRGGRAATQLSKEQIGEIVEYYAQRARYYQTMGFDMVTLHCAYRATLFARFISAKTNKRTDEYGGCIENRARMILELCARIKELCGKDFPIELQITGSETGGTTIEETIEFAKLAEGLVDIFQFRAQTPNLNHPVGYNSTNDDYATLADCAAVKASGTKILCEPIGGYQDPDDMERILANGQADLIGAARAFIVDPDFYKKLVEGRGEDVLPCVRCNKCHVPSLDGKWISVCTVNPAIGMAHKLEKFIEPVNGVKNVAVVGGGPAGMRAALMCAERGHKVTLFEKSDALGGQLKIMDHASFKWPLVKYREYLKAQLDKAGVDIRLNCEVTAETLDGQGYDAVILALGATPKTPNIPGVEKAWDILSVFGNEDKLGKNVVVVGGSESGVEAAMYLCENGHNATVLTRQASLAPEATPIHYREIMQEAYCKLEGFDAVLEATTTEIGDGYVKYIDCDGNEQTIACDSIVALGGMEAHQDEAIALHGFAARTFMIGDCRQVGCIRDCNRTALAAAGQI